MSGILNIFREGSKLRYFFIYGIGQSVNILTPVLITPYIIYVCGESGLGKSSIALSIMFILIVIIDYGSYIKGVKDVSLHRDDSEKLEAIFKAFFALKFVLLIAIIVASAIIVLAIPELKEHRALYFLSLPVLLGQMLNPGWFLQGVENFKWLSITNVIAKLLYVAGVFMLVTDADSYIWVNFMLGAGAVVGNIAGIIWIIRHYSFSGKAVTVSQVKEILVADFNFCLSQLFLSIKQYMPIILVGYLLGDFVAGQYKIIEQIAQLFRTYLQMFFRFIYSSVCFEIAKNKAIGLKMWTKYNGLNYLALMLLLLFLYLFPEPVLQYFQIQHSDLQYMSILLKVSLIIPLLLGVSYPLEQLLFAFDMTKGYVRVTIMFTFIYIILLLLVVPYFKIKGVIVTTGITELILILIYIVKLYLHKKHVKQ